MLLGLQIEEAYHADNSLRSAHRGTGVQHGWIEAGDRVFLFVREWEGRVKEEKSSNE